MVLPVSPTCCPGRKARGSKNKSSKENINKGNFPSIIIQIKTADASRWWKDSKSRCRSSHRLESIITGCDTLITAVKLGVFVQLGGDFCWMNMGGCCFPTFLSTDLSCSTFYQIKCISTVRMEVSQTPPTHTGQHWQLVNVFHAFTLYIIYIIILQKLHKENILCHK